jgi:GT2 family glycosyltransferase
MFEQKKPLVSIVIPSWFEEGQDGRYGEDETFNIANECLKRLIEVTPKELYELIIIDNGSTFVEEEVEKYFKNADILIRNKINLGFGPAVNQGIAVARGMFVMQLNNDILIWKGFLEQMLADFENLERSGDKVGLLMPAIVKEKIRFWDALKMEKKDINMTLNAGKFGVGAEFGSCYLGRKETFNSIAKYRDGYQVLDENFLIGFGEDRWLYREIRMRGLETYRTHNVRVLHVGNLSMSKAKNQEGNRELILKNREYLEELKKKNNIQ